jgi:hypothetical protein
MTRTIIRNAVPVVVAALALALAPAAARADRRYYGETYTAQTAPRGSLDLELWSTFHDRPREGGLHLWRHQVELETGLTDRWDVAVYNIARQLQGKDLEYEALKLETRYRLAEPGRWFVDPVVYLELKKTFVDDRPFSVEEKLILSKDLGRLNLALNLAAEQEFAGGKVEHEGEWALGGSWELVPAFRVGAEAFGSLAEEEGEGGRDKLEAQAWAGPAVSIAFGRTWLVLASGFGLTDSSERVRARAILAFQF